MSDSKFSYTEEVSFITQEVMKKAAHSKNQLTIGVPKENNDEEKRLALTPEAVDMIVEAGHRVVLETEAGLGINYSDARYSESGAEITKDKKTVFECDIIFKISPPTTEEVGMMKQRATVCSMLQLPDFSKETISAMTEKKINGIGYELIYEDNGKCYPIRTAISEIEGATAIFVASELLNNEHGGKGILMGGVPGVSPTEIIIIGAGAAGTIAARAALALGASVKVFDNDVSKLRNIQSALGRTLFTSVFQPNVLLNAFRTADVVIGAMRYINSPVRYLITEDIIKTMKKGALIIDLRVNQGGCFETSCFLPENHPAIFEKYGVLHYCVPNLSSRVARTTSMALSNIFTPFILQLGDPIGGAIGITQPERALHSGFYMYGGKLVNSYVAGYFNLPSNDIGLFLSAY
ncbi:MAG: alanine dehydrogenase [Candidatus Azobacteroides sp.]|nr:alanine dehydrogenase [Candidatus Azobacteroides sp.]